MPKHKEMNQGEIIRASLCVGVPPGNNSGKSNFIIVKLGFESYDVIGHNVNNIYPY